MLMILHYASDFYTLLPEVFLLSVAMLLLGLGAWIGGSPYYQYPVLLPKFLMLAVLSLWITCILVINNPLYEVGLCSGSLVNDIPASTLKTLLLGTAASVCLVSLGYYQHQKMNAFEISILLLLSVVSMMILLSATDLITVYLALEFQSLSFYVLAASKRESELATEAGLKYFFLGALASGIFLLGCAFLYAATGVLHFEGFAMLCTAPEDCSQLCLLGLLLCGIAFFFKGTVAPFHVWAPDVYEGSPTPITAFFATVPKIAIFGLCARFFHTGFADCLPVWQPFFLGCALTSLTVGALWALAQPKVKRLLAFSSIGHVGFFLLALACGSTQGIEAFLLYMCLYVLMSLSVFTILLGLRASTTRIRYVQDFAMLGKTAPLLGFTLAMTFFSMAGIPPFAGFFAKFHVLLATCAANLWGCALFAVCMSAVSCFYYIRVVKIIYFEPATEWAAFSPLDRVSAGVLTVCFFGLLGFACYPSGVLTYLHWTALHCVG